LSLTPEGEKLAAHAARMLAAAEDGLEEIEEGTKEHAGKLSITAPSFLASSALTDVLLGFQAEHPKVNFSITYSTRIENLIESGFDLAIRFGDLADSNLRARKLLDGHGELYAAPSFLAKHGEAKTGRDIAMYDGKWIKPIAMDENCLYDQGGREYPVPFKLTGAFETDGAEQLRQLALKGAGVAFLTRLYVQADLEAGRLVQVLPGWHTEPIGVYAVWPNNVGHRSLVKLFVDYLVQSDLVKHGS